MASKKKKSATKAEEPKARTRKKKTAQPAEPAARKARTRKAAKREIQTNVFFGARR